MSASDGLNDTLDAVSRVLLWCFIFATALALFWFCMMVLAGDWVYGMQSWFITMTREQFDLIMYSALASVKMATFFLFLFPCIGIRLVLRGRKAHAS